MKNTELASLLRRLERPSGPVDVVLDTDTFNEVDDQFALSYLLASQEKLKVQALYAAPFFNEKSSSPEDGMLKSYEEILRLLKLCHAQELEDRVFQGSRGYLPDEKTPVASPAAEDLARRAMGYSPENPLYVIAIGAITNVASALLMEPRLVEKICVIWLGGHPLTWPTAREFNLMQDVKAARVILNSGVPFILVPCMGVASHLTASIPELEAFLGGKNEMCDALVKLFSEYTDDPFGWAKEIWDVSTIGLLVNPDWAPMAVEPSPLLSEDCRWSRDASRHPIGVVQWLNRNAIFRDMYKKLAQGV